ncbi:multiple C2 and transmembrane domain-containing protein 1 isoform X1, partial [Clarias magur]
MEEKAKNQDGAKEHDATSASCQRRIWKNFQDRTRPFLSPKLGSERRSADGKKESGLWMFKRKKKPVLDRIFSSSQPNLSSSSPASLQVDKAEPGCSGGGGGGGPGRSPLAALEGAAAVTHIYTHEVSVSAHSSPRLSVAHLTASQPKSSSLGSACFETLVLDSAVASGQGEQSKNASDS